MKRILLRMFALGTVIALGLIAIAEAQRSGDSMGSPTPAARATSQVAGNDRMPEGNPLRSRMPQQEPNSRGASSTGIRPGIPSSEPMPTRATEGFSLAAATDTGLAAPTGSLPTLAVPMAPDFGASMPTDAVANNAALQPSAADRSPREPAAPQFQDFGPDAGGLPPALVQAGPATSMPAPTNQSFPTDNTRMPTLAVAPISPQPDPSLQDDAGSIPNPLDLPEAQPMHQTSVSPMFAGMPSQADALSAAQVATGNGRPGIKGLEGMQSPQLVVEKIAPAEIQVGRPAIFEVHVRNVGTVAAMDVEIRDEIPQGTRLNSTKPQATRGAQGGLVWKLGTLNPNQEASVEMELMPTDEGEIGSVATVHFQTEASVRTKATRPLLAIEIEAEDEVLKGEELALNITISNPGTGIAENVVLEEHVPDGFRHPAGAELEYEVGDLAPGESRELTLVLEAVHPGPLENVITARGEPSLRTENRRPVEVIAPQLEVAVQGPKHRFLECEAVYNLSVRNPGTAPAKQVEMAVEVPAGMKFVSGTHRAHYEEATRTVHWMLEEIPVQDGPPPVQLTLMPMEAGQHQIRLVTSDDSGAKAEVEQAVYVEGIVAMYFEVADLQDPIEVGGQSLYEIRIVNQGSKEATNVRLDAELPPGLRAIAAEGPTRQAKSLQPNIVSFEPLPRLAAKVDVTYRIRVEGVQPGDLRVRVQVRTDEIETPITKEESTRVYSAQ